MGLWNNPRAGMRHRPLSEIGLACAALLALCLAALVYLHPIATTFRTEIAPPDGDALFNLYILKWVGHESGRGFADFWSPPFFYPATGVLAYSDHLFGPGLVAAAWNALLPGWVGAYNLLFFASFVLTGWTTWLVLRRTGRSWPAALLGGVLYAFCPFRWEQLPHLQVLLMAAIPLTLWTFDRLLERPSGARGAAFALCYALHLSGGCYLAVMIHLPLLVLLCNRLPALWRARRTLGAGRLAILVAVGALAAALLAVTFQPYRRIGARDALIWDSASERHWGASLLSYLQPSHWNFYAALWPSVLRRPENSLFPGIVATGLCLAGAALALRRPRRSGALVSADLAGAAGTPPPAAGGPDTLRYVPGAPGVSPQRAAGGSISSASPAGAGAVGSLERGAAGWRAWVPLLLVALGGLGGELVTWSELPALAPIGRWLPNYRLPLLLVAAGVVLGVALGRWQGLARRLGRPLAAMEPWPRGVLLAGVASALASLPLVYIPLARLLPGFSAMRVPARFQAFTLFAVASCAAAVFDHLAARLRAPGGARARRRLALFTVAVFAGALIESAPRHLPWGVVPEEDDFPDVYDWIADQPDVRALLELPLVVDPSPRARDQAAVQAMYYGTLHWRPIVNGFSAHFPAAYVQLTAVCCHPMPDPATLATLRAEGVSHILIHRSDLENGERHALDDWAAGNAAIATLAYSGQGDRVYRLAPVPLDP
jgi:hypothetical protein